MNNPVRNKRPKDSKGKFIEYSLPDHQIISLYTNGVSEKVIAERFRVSRNAIRRRLIKVNIHIRSHSEARRITWKNYSPSQRANQMRMAHQATKGQKISWKTKCKHAKTVEKKPSNFSPQELQLKKLLSKRGIETIHQKAIGAYNCDLAAYPVAMEIFGGNWHFYGNHARRFEKRTKYLLSHGWFVLIFLITKRDSSSIESIANYATSYIKRIRREKSSVCEYRMIWATGKLETRGTLESDHFAFKPSFTSK